MALDGKGVNGPFAAALVKHLTVPGLDLRIALGHVRDEVLAVTGNRQEPYFTGSLGGGTLALVAADARLVAPPPPPGDAAETVRICREVAAISSLATLGVLERQHKGRPAGECVAARIEEVRQQQAVVVAPRPVPGVGLPAQKSGAVPLTAAQERALKPKDSFKECDVCPEMVVVPAGSFMMGSVPGEMRYSFEDERPKHKVSLARPFAVAKFETTFGEWDACVADGGCQHRPDDKGWGRGSRPVINVSWDDIVNQYLPWLSRKTGKTYRLLTEAEWEYAARAGTTTAYYFGRNESLFCTYENVPDLTWKRQRYSANANCQHGYVAITAPVGSFRPNAFGLYDMLGNVKEFVQDCYRPNYKGAPTDGSAVTTGDCSRRRLRGGAWNSLARVTFRSWHYLAVRNADDGGFRVARAVVVAK